MEVGDGHLIALVRGGDTAAFDSLYERHISIASTVAKRNVDNPSDAEDIVAEAFQSVLQSLVAGKGPDTFFRAYLLSTVTRLSHHRNRKAGRTLPSGDEGILDHAVGEPDAVVQAFESHAVAKAFRMLPERWQAVLWYLDVERMRPAAAAPLLGLSANAVSALALRAREGLRRQYLQCHISTEAGPACAEYVAKLGTFIRGGLSQPASKKVKTHLAECPRCTAVLAELKDVEGSMKAVLVPLVTGVPLAAWAGSSTGLGIIGSLAPVKAAVMAPLIAQPAAATILAAAAVGLVLGTAGVIDQLVPGNSSVQQTFQTAAAPNGVTIGPTTDAPAPAPSETAPVPVAPTAEETAPIEHEPVEQPANVPAEAPVPEPDEPPASGTVPRVVTQPPSAPAASPSPVPSKSPGPKQRSANGASVTASVDVAKDWRSNSTPLTIDFAVSGSAPLGKAMAEFSAPDGARIVSRTIEAPKGWSCSLENQSKAVCRTDSLRRGNLHFHLTLEFRRHSDGTLKYGLQGAGLDTKAFGYDF